MCDSASVTTTSSTKAKKTMGDNLIDIINLLKSSNIKMYMIREE